MRKNLFAYVLILLVFGLGIYWILQAGSRLESHTLAGSAPGVAADSSAPASLPAAGAKTPDEAAGAVGALRERLQEPLSLLLAQVILIVLLARIFGAWFVKMGQPAVIGEMVAGIVLGPSVAGVLLPGASHFIFPASSLGRLRMLSQVGVILFMFAVGMEMDVRHLRGKAAAAVMISHVSIVFPYFLGVLLSWFIYPSFAPPNVRFVAFALFMGIAMSITAFPVLARIIEERGLTQTYLGSAALTCAAVDDVTAWSILAVVIAFAKAGTIGSSAMTLLLVAAFVLAMFFLGRPMLNRLTKSQQQPGAIPGKGIVVGILTLVFSSALFTEIIGIHALFGAFLAGVIMPANPQFRAHLRDRLESFSSGFLLPLFFAFTGLRTQIGLLNDGASWAVCLAIVLTATAGKLGGSMVAARCTGMNWPDSFALGALMNTRGLVELIVLNIGLDLGILSPRVFAMMVMMALMTTLLTGPLLSLGNAFKRRQAPDASAAASDR